MGQRDGIMGQEEPLERSPLLSSRAAPLGAALAAGAAGADPDGSDKSTNVQLGTHGTSPAPASPPPRGVCGAPGAQRGSLAPPGCSVLPLLRPGLGRELRGIFPPNLVAGIKRSLVLLGHGARGTFPARSKGGFAAAVLEHLRMVLNSPKLFQNDHPGGISAVPRRWGSARAGTALPCPGTGGTGAGKGGPGWLCWGPQAVFCHFTDFWGVWGVKAAAL